MCGCLRAQLTAMPNDMYAAEIDMFKWTGHASLECIGIGGLGHSFDTDTAYRHAAEDLAYVATSIVAAYACSVLYVYVYVVFPVGRVCCPSRLSYGSSHSLPNVVHPRCCTRWPRMPLSSRSGDSRTT
jgi:hypothetical protein